jgi:hypothetical protein
MPYLETLKFKAHVGKRDRKLNCSTSDREHRRYLDNIFIERLWRSLKYEDIYIKAYASVPEAPRGIGGWLNFYWRAPAPGAGLSDPERSVPGPDSDLWGCGQRKCVDHC